MKVSLEDLEIFAKGKEYWDMKNLAVDYANYCLERYRKPYVYIDGRTNEITIEILQGVYKSLRAGSSIKKYILEETNISYWAILKHLEKMGLSARNWVDEVPKWDKLIGRAP